MQIKLTQICLPALAVILISPSLVHAHTGVGNTAGFLHGFGHPIGGLDHILAMVAVGVWAAQIGGKATWAAPTTFVGVMVIGGVLGTSGVAVPFVEQGIVMSVLILGVLIAAAARLPFVLSMTIVGLFAVFHGHAHGAEMPDVASGLIYGIGFALATALLHLCGIGVGVLFQKAARMQLVRYAGGAIAVVGVYLFLA